LFGFPFLDFLLLHFLFPVYSDLSIRITGAQIQFR
jgi:hypothetical protein